MTDRLQALIELRETISDGRVPKMTLALNALASDATRDMGFPTSAVIGWIMSDDDIRALGAALSLHNAVLPEVSIRLIDHGAEYEDIGRWDAKVNWEHVTWQPNFTASGPFGYEGQCNNPARAWLIAILSALIAMEGAEDDT